MTHLYCPTPCCGEYLGSLGGDSCRHCGWQAGTVKSLPPDDYGEPDDDCTYCRGDGSDRYSDHMMACPICDGSGKA